MDLSSLRNLKVIQSFSEFLDYYFYDIYLFKFMVFMLIYFTKKIRLGIFFSIMAIHVIFNLKNQIFLGFYFFMIFGC